MKEWSVLTGGLLMHSFSFASLIQLAFCMTGLGNSDTCIAGVITMGKT
jgi:hypothetical protein